MTSLCKKINSHSKPNTKSQKKKEKNILHQIMSSHESGNMKLLYIPKQAPVRVYMTEKKKKKTREREIGASFAHMSRYNPPFYRNFYIIIIK